jgi:hypothetical protein
MLPREKKDSRDQEEQGGLKQGQRRVTTMSFPPVDGR